MSDKEPQQATPPGDLEFQIMSATVPKNEREWWAQCEITRLRAELADARNLLREAGYVYDPDVAMTEDKTR